MRRLPSHPLLTLLPTYERETSDHHLPFFLQYGSVRAVARDANADVALALLAPTAPTIDLGRWLIRGPGAHHTETMRAISSWALLTHHLPFFLGTFLSHSTHFWPGRGTASTTSISSQERAWTTFVSPPPVICTLGFIPHPAFPTPTNSLPTVHIVNRRVHHSPFFLDEGRPDSNWIRYAPKATRAIPN